MSSSVGAAGGDTAAPSGGSVHNYRLVYFNLRARGELCRLLFAVAGVPYEDVRIEHSRWPQLKPDTLFGRLPQLTVDGVTICQSYAIARFLARQFGLAGRGEWECARADMIVGCLEDAVQPLLAIMDITDSAKQAELQKKYEDEQLPEMMSKFDKFLTDNDADSGFFVGSAMTWADVAFANGCSWLTHVGLRDPLANCPRLKALQQRVESQPNIAEWIRRRPKTAL